MSATRPKVSIVVSVYQAENYIGQCIESCINQTLKEIEVILVNDGSKDKSLSICRAYEQRDLRIRVIDQPNQGTSAARNNGVRIAGGEFLTVVDGDDWLEPETCEYAYEEACKENLDVVFWQRINEFDNRSIRAAGVFGEDRLFDESEIKALHRRAIGPIGGELYNPQTIDSFSSVWGKLYRIDLFRVTQLQFTNQKEVGAADIFFTFQCFHHVKRAKYIHRHFSHYRKDNPNSITKSHGSKLFERFQVLFDKMEQQMEVMGLGEPFLQALQNRIAISIMNIGLALTSFRNTQSRSEKYILLSQYLNHPRYRVAFSNLQTKYLSPHWRIFFLFCQLRFTPGVYIMLKLMSSFRTK